MEEELVRIIKDPQVLNYNYCQMTHFNNSYQDNSSIDAYFSQLLNILSFGNLDDYKVLRNSMQDSLVARMDQFINNSNYEYKLKTILVLKAIKSNYFKTWNNNSNIIRYQVIAELIDCSSLKTLEVLFLKELIGNDVIRAKLNPLNKSIKITQINFNRDILMKSNIEYEKYCIRGIGISDGSSGNMDLDYMIERLKDISSVRMQRALKVLDVASEVRQPDSNNEDSTYHSAVSSSGILDDEQFLRKGSLDTIIL